MKNKSDKTTQSSKKGSSKQKQSGKTLLERQTEGVFSTDRENEGYLNIEQNHVMSEFERGYYEGRKAYANEMRSREHGHTGESRRSSTNRYGEHPESLGAEEYRGSNKRHPGLGYNDYTEGESNTDHRSRGSQRFRTAGRTGGSEHRSYNPQHQSEQYNTRYGSERFPEDRNYDEYLETDHDFQNRGHQTSGQTEGFGFRSGQHHGQNWEEQDNYRRGNTAQKRGKGRYGNR